MGEISVKSENRSLERKGWIDIYDCLDTSYLKKKGVSIFDSSFSLKELHIKPNMGFVPHKHINKDFIIIPIEGSLSQKNNTGNSYLAKKGEIHIMSSGSGITHFEYNHSTTEDLKCIVFEITPKKINTKPKCVTIALNAAINQLENIIPTDKESKKQAVIEYIQAHHGYFEEGYKLNYIPEKKSNGVLIFIVNGAITINKVSLSKKDTICIWDTKLLNIITKENSELVIFDLPTVL